MKFSLQFKVENPARKMIGLNRFHSYSTVKKLHCNKQTVQITQFISPFDDCNNMLTKRVDSFGSIDVLYRSFND